MPPKKRSSETTWIDPDDAPPLTKEWFRTATPHEDGKPTPRGRPKLAAPKKLVSLRLDQDVVEAFRASGAGWQSRINAGLRSLLAREKKSQKRSAKARRAG